MKKGISIIIIFLVSIVSAQESLSPEERTGIFILVDNTPPIIIIHSPQPASYSNAEQILVNFTVVDPSLDSIWYSINNKENITISSHFYLSLSIGSYNLKIYANDTKNRQNFSEVYFTIDNSIPSQQPSSGSGNSGSGGSNSLSKEKNESSIQNEHNQKEPEKNITLNIPAEDNNITSTKEEQNDRITFNFLLLIPLFILLLLIIIILSLIIYKFIKNRNKKQKWKRKKLKP